MTNNMIVTWDDKAAAIALVHEIGMSAEEFTVHGDAIVQAFARHRTTSLAAQEALAGYRAAVSFISADSWDGCSDCINILIAARCADMTDAMTINETAEHLKRIRLHYDPAALPPAPSLAAQDGLVEALERCAQIVEQWNHRQNEKVDDIKYIVRNALSAIKGDKS